MVEHRHCILITLHNNQQIQLYWFISSSLPSRVALRESNILSCLINCINFGCFLRRWNFKVGFICREHSPQKRWERKKFYESSIIADFRRWFGKYLMAFLSSFWELSNARNSKADRKTCKQVKTFKLEMLAERELKHETSDIDTIKIVPSKFTATCRWFYVNIALSRIHHLRALSRSMADDMKVKRKCIQTLQKMRSQASLADKKSIYVVDTLIEEFVLNSLHNNL